VTRLEAALAYASWGWPVLPIVPNGKLPATAHGVHDATTDEATIRKWFDGRDDLNIGIAAGARSGLVVFDIDPRNGGDDSFAAWVKTHGELEAGALQLTAGGGQHFLAAHDPSIRSCKLVDGVDLLADGRYFLAYPSTIEGRAYRWEVSSDPFDGVAPASVPPEWLSAIGELQRGKTKRALVAGASFITGNRNDGLAALAGAMRHHGMTAPEIHAALAVVNEQRCEMPLPASEVRQIAESISRYDFAHDTAANAAMADIVVEGLFEQETAQAWLIPADDFASKPAPISWLVKGWWQADALIMVHGPSGGGKTFAVLDWALRMAAGLEDWNGCKVRPGPVVYLAGEGHHGLRGRVAAWKQHHGVRSLRMWLSKAGCDLDTPEGYQRVALAIRELPERPGVIIVDTLHRFLSGDENSSQDARRMLDACARLMGEFGCSVVLVHHTGVNEEAQHRARGSSAWRGALDIEISVVPGKDGGPLQIVQRKSKDAELAAPVFAQLLSVQIEGWFDEDGVAVTSAVLTAAEGEVTPKAKRPSKVDEARQKFERAWAFGGMEMRGDRPYVSRSAMKTWMVENCDFTERTVRNQLNPSRDDGLISKLIAAGCITAHEHGWIVADDLMMVAGMVEKLKR
jgi:hypothetical protein